LESQGKSHP